MYNFVNLTSITDLSNYTMVIPSVSVGNVGQLAVDLLITSLNMKKVGTIWHPAILPSVGSDPFFAQKDTVCTACEMYANETQKIAAIQLRSGLEFEKAVSFFQELTICLKNTLNIKNVIILTTTFAHEMHNISPNTFRYISNQEHTEWTQNLNIPKIEPSSNGKYIVHGAGFAIKLYEYLIAETEFKCSVIVKYTSEGDNRPDAVAMLELLQKILNIKVENIVCPSSWQNVFGNPPPVEIF